MVDNDDVSKSNRVIEKLEEKFETVVDDYQNNLEIRNGFSTFPFIGSIIDAFFIFSG